MSRTTVLAVIAPLSLSETARTTTPSAILWIGYRMPVTDVTSGALNEVCAKLGMAQHTSTTAIVPARMEIFCMFIASHGRCLQAGPRAHHEEQFFAQYRRARRVWEMVKWDSGWGRSSGRRHWLPQNAAQPLLCSYRRSLGYVARPNG